MLSGISSGIPSVICYNGNMQKKVIHTENTPYGLIEIEDRIIYGDMIRFLMVDGNPESAMYLDDEKKYDLLFPYMQRFSYAFVCRPETRNTLLIGGGAFSYPKYYLEHHRRSRITVIELSQTVIDLSKKYFRLDELDIEQKSNLRIVCEDAFTWLKDTDEKFDWIINDAFIGDQMQGRQPSFLMEVVSHLNPGGIYMENHVSARSGFGARSLYRREKQMQEYFDSVTKIICDEDVSRFRRQNFVLTGILQEGTDGKD